MASLKHKKTPAKRNSNDNQINKDKKCGNSKKTARNRVRSKRIDKPVEGKKNITEQLQTPITELDKNSNPFKDKNFENNYRIVFANVDGLNNQKLGRLREITRNDHLLVLNETNWQENDAKLFSANGIGVLSKLKSLDNVTFKNGNRVQPTKTVNNRQGKKVLNCRKRSGFGSAIVSKLGKGVTIYSGKFDDEILWSKISLNGVNGIVVGGYRSPSSKNKTDIDIFYNRCSEIIRNECIVRDLDFIIYVADDNASLKSSCGASRYAASCAKIMAEKYRMLDMLGSEPTRGTNQPDSCMLFLTQKN